MSIILAALDIVIWLVVPQESVPLKKQNKTTKDKAVQYAGILSPFVQR